MSKIYLDNAATTCMHQEVIDAMHNAMQSCYGNPSSSHDFGRQAKAGIEQTRKHIATELGVSPAEIVFTSGGTESNNFILRSAADYLGIEQIITSPIEHKCVLETCLAISKLKKIPLIFVNVQENGDVDLDDLTHKLQQNQRKTLVSLMHANNEIGNITDIKKIAQICQLNHAVFHSDMIQTIGHYPINLSELGVDFASCSAHKFHGPKGAGFVYAKKALGIKAQITGGGQERNLRSGTENTYGIVGLGKAFEMAYSNINQHQKQISDLKEYTINQLQKKVPNVIFNGKSAELNHSLYTVLSICLPYKDPLIGFELELKGIAISQGSACSSGATKASGVIASLYTADRLEQITPLRISFSIYNTKQEIDKLCDVLHEITTNNLQKT